MGVTKKGSDQNYVDAGIEYFVVQTLDPDDEESIALAISELAPRLHR